MPDGNTSPATLLALAARVEAEGRYNVAKLLRAAARAQVQREADERLEAAPRGEALLATLRSVADAFERDPLLGPLAEPMRVGVGTFAAGDVPLIDAVPDPQVCRRCGYVDVETDAGWRSDAGLVSDADAVRGACPRCDADRETFLVQRPVWWLERHDPASALRSLARTPRVLRALLARVPADARARRPRPDVWSPHEVIAHLRDAQGVLEQRVGLMLDHDDPDLEVKMVWSWNSEERPATTDEVLAEYLGSRERVLAQLRSAPPGAWWRTGRHREFGRLSLTQQVSYFAAHEPTHLRQVRLAARRAGGAIE